MSDMPQRMEIDHKTIRLIIGLIAISLATVTSNFSSTPLPSISFSYHEGGWTRDIFVGFLFAIAAFLLAYNGKSTTEMVLSKVAAISAIGVAMFPCKCGDHIEKIENIHGISAAVMFIVLAIFCYIFYKRAYLKGHAQARMRASIYAVSGIIIVAAIIILTVDNLSNGSISLKITRLTFYAEAAGLIAFGIAWLTASKILPFITNEDERLRL